MKTRLAVIFTLFLALILLATGWASTQVSILAVPPEVLYHPWFIATLTDTYLAFLTFWVWVAYRETSNLARIAWLIAILLTGNMAMAVYVLNALRKLPPGAGIDALLLRRA